MKVFIVFEGAYSDRDVAQVFSTRQRAEDYIAHRCRLYRERRVERPPITDEQAVNAMELDIHDYEVDEEYIP